MLVNHFKSIGLCIIAILGGAPFWFAYKAAVLADSFDSIYISYAFLCMLVFLTATGLLLLLSETYIYIFLAVFVSMAPSLYFFDWSFLLIIVFGLLVAASFYGYMRVREEIRNRINFKVSILLRQGLPSLLTALSLLLATAYFIETKRVPSLITIKDILPQRMFEIVFENAGIYLGGRFIPDFDYNTTVDDYIAEQLKAGGVDSASLPKNEQTRLLAEARHQFLERLQKDGTEISLSGDSKLKDVLYEAILSRSEHFLQTYSRYVPIAFAVAFFLFLRTVALPFGWIVIWICSLLIHVFIHLGFVVHVTEETRKERLEWA